MHWEWFSEPKGLIAEYAEEPAGFARLDSRGGCFYVNILGCALAVGELRRALLHSFGTALADQEQADSFQQVGGRIHPPGQEYVGLRFVLVDADLA